MGLIRRIENGTTTVRDADKVRSIINAKIGLFLIGLGLGVIAIAAAIYLFGG